MITTNLTDFYTKVVIDRPLIAVDYGSKKLGLAVSSRTLSMALPLKTLIVYNEKEKVTLIAEEAKAQDAWGIVLGLPLCMDGSFGEQAAIVEKFATNLINFLTLPIFLQDERLTTKAANNYLKSFGLDRRRRNNQDDSVAASMILESTLAAISRLKKIE